MAKLNKENVKSILLGILVILSIYLYYNVYFQSPISEYITRFEQRFTKQDEDQIKNIADMILIKPDRMYLNISNRVSFAIMSDQKEYKDLLNSFIKAIKKGLLQDNLELKKEYLPIKRFKEGPVFMLEYSYHLNLDDFVFELVKKKDATVDNDFTFDKIFIKEDKGAHIYFYNSEKSSCYFLDTNNAGFKEIATDIMQSAQLIYSWSDSLGFSQIVKDDALIPVELSNINFSQIKQKDDEQKKEAVVRRIFPDTILTVKNILKDGSLVITDERRWLMIKPDGEYIFRFTDFHFADNIDSLKQAIEFYLKTFYSSEDVRILKIEKQGEMFRLYLINRIDGIDVLPENLDSNAIIEVEKNRLKEVRGYLTNIFTIRNAKIKVDGMTAIDTIKERKGDIFIKDIGLKYILKNGSSSYPYWEIITQSGTVYIETIK